MKDKHENWHLRRALDSLNFDNPSNDNLFIWKMITMHWWRLLIVMLLRWGLCSVYSLTYHVERRWKRRGEEERTSLFSLDPHQRQPLWLGYKSTHTRWTFHFCMHNWYLLERPDPLNSCPKIKSVNVICVKCTLCCHTLYKFLCDRGQTWNWSIFRFP